jgi:hypothetical protein
LDAPEFGVQGTVLLNSVSMKASFRNSSTSVKCHMATWQRHAQEICSGANLTMNCG